MSFYSGMQRYSTRNNFVEPPSVFERLLALLPRTVSAHVRKNFAPSRFSIASWRQAYRNFRWQDLLHLPNFLILIWIYALLWGERWSFNQSINECHWDNWERWPPGATPHHLIFIADPQLIDPHTYPDRSWPLSSITITLTDTYLERSYTRLQQSLHPDTVFFLGDLFDGGREWIPDNVTREDPAWAQGRRPSKEKKFVETWHKSYGQKFWLKEYDRFGKIFFGHWNDGGTQAGYGQRGRRVISSLPGNHDLGFAEQISLPVRNRFNAFFGDGNRVDIIGNHTFVSVDTVSLSAQDVNNDLETAKIYEPVQEFLHNVRATKRRSLARELLFQRGEPENIRQGHLVEDLYSSSFSNLPSLDPGEGSPDLPTILLTHVPLYRDPGTPCGPLREHWPPTQPSAGQSIPVVPDERNAISISKGYQYQNVLSEHDSVELVETIGNVKYAFSGDDHDYCEIVHPPNKNSLREITVKSMSFAMGVRKPGFLMLSMWNPIDNTGQSFGTLGGGHGGASSTGSPTIETHLCLLPDQLSIFINYGILLGITVCAIIGRALLIPILKLQPLFPVTKSFEAMSLLPINEKRDRDEERHDRKSTSSTSSTASHDASNLAARPFTMRTSRNTSPSFASDGGYGLSVSAATPVPAYSAPFLPNKARMAYTSSSQSYVRLAMRESFYSAWRVAWVAGGLFLWLVTFG